MSETYGNYSSVLRTIYNVPDVSYSGDVTIGGNLDLNTGSNLDCSTLSIDDTSLVTQTRAIQNVTQLDVDNIRIDGNTISTTSGNIIISPTDMISSKTIIPISDNTYEIGDFGNVYSEIHSASTYTDAIVSTSGTINTTGTIVPTSDNSDDLGTSANRYKDVYAKRLILGLNGIPNAIISEDGNNMILEHLSAVKSKNNILPFTNGNLNLGSGSLQFQTLYSNNSELSQRLALSNATNYPNNSVLYRKSDNNVYGETGLTYNDSAQALTVGGSCSIGTMTIDGATNTISTSSGNTVIDNTNANGQIQLVLGSNTNTSRFELQSDNTTALIRVKGDGEMTFNHNHIFETGKKYKGSFSTFVETLHKISIPFSKNNDHVLIYCEVQCTSRKTNSAKPQHVRYEGVKGLKDNSQNGIFECLNLEIYDNDSATDPIIVVQAVTDSGGTSGNIIVYYNPIDPNPVDVLRNSIEVRLWSSDGILEFQDGSIIVASGDTPLNNALSTTTTIMKAMAVSNFGINTLTPDTSALLDLTSTVAGFLPPRLTTAQRNAISSPATGLVVYNTTTNNINAYDGSAWNELVNQQYGQTYFNTNPNATDTVITTTTTWTRVRCDTSGNVVSSASVGWGTDVTNRADIKYTGISTKTVNITATISYYSKTANRDFLFGLVKTGGFDANDELTSGTVEPASITKNTSGTSSTMLSVTLNAIMSVATGNVITLVCQNLSDDTDLRVQYCTITAQ